MLGAISLLQAWRIRAGISSGPLAFVCPNKALKLLQVRVFDFLLGYSRTKYRSEVGIVAGVVAVISLWEMIWLDFLWCMV